MLTKRSFFKVILLLTFFSLTASVCVAKDVIQWRVTDWPPMYILTGTYKGQGVIDQMLNVFEKEMPQYQHKRVKMNTTRAWNQIKGGEKVCHPATFPRPYGQLSDISFLIPPHQIVVREEKAGLLDGKSLISLDQMISDKRFKLGVFYGRYGGILNPVVDKHKGEKMMHTTPKYKSIWKMLFIGRTDYIIEYPFIISFLKKNDTQFSDVSFVRIQETPDPLKVYVGCPGNKWGQKVIARVNTILREERPRFRKFMESWLDPASVATLRGAYQKEFGKIME